MFLVATKELYQFSEDLKRMETLKQIRNTRSEYTKLKVKFST